MRNAFAQELALLAAANDSICLLSGDIGNKLFDDFKLIAPQRFINCGIAEAGMMSMAAGLSLRGIIPVVYTIAPFVTIRCLEQIKISVAYHEAKVIIVGTGAGLSYAELGCTHYSLEDIAILQAIPNINIITPSDPEEVKWLLREAVNSEISSYIRLGKKDEMVLAHNKAIKIGQINRVCAGTDGLILTYGPIVEEAIQARQLLAQNGFSVSVYTVTSVRPLPMQEILNVIKNIKGKVVILEEHFRYGGLYTALLDQLVEVGELDHVKSLVSLSVYHDFIHALGKQKYMRSTTGLDASSIVRVFQDF